MKKLTSFIAIAILSLSIAFAQTPASKAKKTAKSTAPTASAVPKKKDGTADMRYKENKAVTVSGPKKKDGTADMRYKANKGTSATTGPKKKDGTSDMRYKANKPAKKQK